MSTEQLTGLQLAVKLLAQIGDDDSDAIARHCRGASFQQPIPDALGRTQETRILTERGFFLGRLQGVSSAP